MWHFSTSAWAALQQWDCRADIEKVLHKRSGTIALRSAQIHASVPRSENRANKLRRHPRKGRWQVDR